MKKFLSGLVTFILLIVIVGGIGYIGYNYYFMNPTQFQNGASNTEQAGQTGQATTENNSMPGMQHGGMNMQQPSSTTSVNTPAAEIAAVALQNRDSLNKALSSLNEAIEYMSLDPYGSTKKTQDEGNMSQMPGMATSPSVQGSSPATVNNGSATPSPSIQGNTTINIFPSTNSTQAVPADNSMNNSLMQDMGTTYDPNKMEQLHSGLFKLSLGMQLLEQLEDDLADSAGAAAANTQDLAQYYSLQYTNTLQNKSRLEQAMGYINEASGLVNINPYVSSAGLVYDQERMQQIHKSVFKLADGVAALNMLDDDLTKQAITAANTAQTYANNSYMAQMNNMVPEPTGTDNLFGNLDIQFIINSILIVFVVAFILGILGFVFSLLKTPGKNPQR